MQIATIHQWQYALDNAVKVLRLVWRHLLTLTVIGMMINMVHLSTANWKNIFITLLITSFCDWAKLKISFRIWKCDHCQNLSSSAPYSSITQQNDWNAEIIGTPAYLSNLGHRY